MPEGKKKVKSDPYGKKKVGRPKKKLTSILNNDDLILNMPPPPDDDDDDDDTPQFLLIPLNNDGNFGGKSNDSKTLTFEDAFDFPLASRGSKRKLQSPRKKTSRELRLLEAKKEIDAYNKKHFDIIGSDNPIKDQILLMPTDVSVKATILKKFEDNEKSKNSFDQSKFMSWIKDVLQIPFQKTIPLPIKMNDGHVKINEYLGKVREQLKTSIAGQEEAKEEIVDFIARLVANPESRGNILALSGPKGVGKTRLIRRGVAEALKRPFHAINLGGMNDVHVLTGHDLTYTGAKYGRMAQILIQSQCENPVIYLDEIDKIQGGSDRGMEVFRVLTHILDEEQNHEFFDEYFSGIKLNLSKILFVASLNNPEEIDPILRDRLKIIKVNKLDLSTKIDIVRNYVVPELCKEVAFPQESLEISDEIIKYIINVKTESEEGCRQLKRKFETIIQKLNTQRITCTGVYEMPEIENCDNAEKAAENDEIKKIQPQINIVLTQKLVDNLLKYSDISDKNSHAHLYS